MRFVPLPPTFGISLRSSVSRLEDRQSSSPPNLAFPQHHIRFGILSRRGRSKVHDRVLRQNLSHVRSPRFGALSLSSLLGKLIYGIRPNDPHTFGVSP
jgi:hypothetical protein